METYIDNIEINYQDKGSGDFVLVLHGWGAGIDVYRSIIDVLSEKYRVLAPDMPGFGKSEEPAYAWSVDDYVDFAVKFLKKFEVKKATLIGHSHGGRVLIKLASKTDLPFEIEKLILVDSAGIVPKQSAMQKIRLLGYKAAKNILKFKPVSKIFPSALEDMRKKRGSADYNSATPVMRASLVKVVNEDLRHLMPYIKTPTLLIWGENDTATPLSDGKLMESLIPGSGLVTLKNAGHYSFLDQQYTFKKVIKSFLQI